MSLRTNGWWLFSTGLALAVPLILHGAELSVEHFSVAGGGGRGTNGAWCLLASVGPPHAGRSASVPLDLAVGYWALLEEEVLPSLGLVLSDSLIVVSWRAPSPGYRLQEATVLSLSPAAWADVTEPAVRRGDRMEMQLSVSAGERFFRLRRDTSWR